MNNINSILLEGNVTRAPQGRSTPKGTPVCSFSVASNRFFWMGESMQKEVSFFDVETWSGTAERCVAELKKGRGVRVIGHLKQERWVDADGKQRSSVKIVADHVEFKPLGQKNESQAAVQPETVSEHGVAD